MTPQRGGDDWEARRAALGERLDENRMRTEAEEKASRSRVGGMQGMAHGLKVASEFVAGIAVGAFIGFGIDHFFGTRPFGLIVFLLFGFAAGILNVLRGAAAVPGSNGRGEGN